MAKIVSPQVAFDFLLQQTKNVTPEIFTADGNGYLNLLEGRWQEPGTPRPFTSPIDGSEIGSLPMLSREVALRAAGRQKRSRRLGPRGPGRA
ncbi:hypothetical protein [Hymenobacter sp. 102]|uniref:hypothetical protein n=1 Tax=Hymenobacter sp. 102 TaxID=3403152 RepID=UPI003CF658D4